jgi:hypothetical protein
MGRRYKTTYSQIKDKITYHVHDENGQLLQSYDSRQAAVNHKETNEGYYIVKTRVNIPIR